MTVGRVFHLNAQSWKAIVVFRSLSHENFVQFIFLLISLLYIQEGQRLDATRLHNERSEFRQRKLSPLRLFISNIINLVF